MSIIRMLKSDLELLKSMQKNPKFYLATYFTDLKAELDLEYAINLKEKEKYLEIINSIESVEQLFYNTIKPFNTFNNEIEMIEKQIDDSMNNDPFHLNMQGLVRSIDEIKYKIEQIIFANKSVIYLKDWIIRWDNKNGRWDEKTFLLIINDQYIRKSSLFNTDLEYFNREKLIINLVREKLENIQYVELSKFKHKWYIDIEMMNKTKIEISNKKVNYIDPNTFQGLKNLREICFHSNRIEGIHEKTFDGLTNLEEISFDSNEIKELHENVFNGLRNLKKINFNNNEIKEISVNAFSELVSLKEVDLSLNQILEIDQNTFENLKIKY